SRSSRVLSYQASFASVVGCLLSLGAFSFVCNHVRRSQTRPDGYAYVMAARRAPPAIWSGAISFGLVNIPVRMYSAIDEQDVHFHLLHTTDNGRIGYAKVCKKDGKPVPDDEVRRAYEVSEGTY